MVAHGFAQRIEAELAKNRIELRKPWTKAQLAKAVKLHPWQLSRVLGSGSLATDWIARAVDEIARELGLPVDECRELASGRRRAAPEEILFEAVSQPDNPEGSYATGMSAPEPTGTEQVISARAPGIAEPAASLDGKPLNGLLELIERLDIARDTTRKYATTYVAGERLPAGVTAMIHNILKRGGAVVRYFPDEVRDPEVWRAELRSMIGHVGSIYEVRSMPLNFVAPGFGFLLAPVLPGGVFWWTSPDGAISSTRIYDPGLVEDLLSQTATSSVDNLLLDVFSTGSALKRDYERIVDFNRELMKYEADAGEILLVKDGPSSSWDGPKTIDQRVPILLDKLRPELKDPSSPQYGAFQTLLDQHRKRHENFDSKNWGTLRRRQILTRAGLRSFVESGVPPIDDPFGGEGNLYTVEQRADTLGRVRRLLGEKGDSFQIRLVETTSNLPRVTHRRPALWELILDHHQLPVALFVESYTRARNRSDRGEVRGISTYPPLLQLMHHQFETAWEKVTTENREITNFIDDLLSSTR